MSGFIDAVQNDSGARFLLLVFLAFGLFMLAVVRNKRG